MYSESVCRCFKPVTRDDRGAKQHKNKSVNCDIKSHVSDTELDQLRYIVWSSEYHLFASVLSGVREPYVMSRWLELAACQQARGLGEGVSGIMHSIPMFSAIESCFKDDGVSTDFLQLHFDTVKS